MESRATDINLNACICTKKTGHENGVLVETCCDNLVRVLFK